MLSLNLKRSAKRVLFNAVLDATGNQNNVPYTEAMRTPLDQIKEPIFLRIYTVVTRPIKRRLS